MGRLSKMAGTRRCWNWTAHLPRCELVLSSSKCGLTSGGRSRSSRRRKFWRRRKGLGALRPISLRSARMRLLLPVVTVVVRVMRAVKKDKRVLKVKLKSTPRRNRRPASQPLTNLHRNRLDQRMRHRISLKLLRLRRRTRPPDTMCPSPLRTPLRRMRMR